MPHPPKLTASCAKMQTKRSAWTPLNHPLSNTKVFDERRNLLAKWFARWSDSQRKAVLQDFVLACSVDQLCFLSISVSRRLPLQAADFTCLLPRTLSLYLFSFLDPRSLSRCAQVSWHWKSIVELDQLWMPKCLRHGWIIHFSPTPLEQGVWKRHYIHTVEELRHSPPQMASFQQQCVIPDVSRLSSRHDAQSEQTCLLSQECCMSTCSTSRRLKMEKQSTATPPWRDSDRCPKDTLRFNYLDNLDPIEQALTAKSRSRGSTCHSSTPKPDEGGKKTLSDNHYKLRKAKSLMFLSSNCRPHHPSPSPHHHHHHHHDYHHLDHPQNPPLVAHSSVNNAPKEEHSAQTLLRLAQWNAGIRPGPVKTPVPRLSVEALKASQRSHRSLPSAPLFEI